jgi:hypothetical protein
MITGLSKAGRTAAAGSCVARCGQSVHAGAGSRDYVFMALMRSVDVYPTAGFEKHFRGRDPDAEAFARSAQRVAALCTEALPALGLRSGVSHLRVMVGMHERRYPDVAEARLMHVARHDGFHSAHAYVPAGVAEMPADARALLVLDVLVSVLEQLGDAHDWDPAALAALRDGVLQRGLAHRWTGSWKSSPDRRRRARVAALVRDDGRGQIWVETAYADGEDLRGTASADTRADLEDFRRYAQLLHWEGPDTVVFGPFDDGPIHPAQRAKVEKMIATGPVVDVEGNVHRTDEFLASVLPGDPSRVRIDDMLPVATTPLPTADCDLPRPAVIRWSEPRSARHRIRAGSGGDMSFKPVTYSVALADTMSALDTPEWQAWWAAGRLGELDVRFHLGSQGSEPLKLVVRHTRAKHRGDDDPADPDHRAGDTWTAEVKRPRGSVPGNVDPLAQARADLTELLAKLRARTGLPPHPPIPEVPIDAARVERVQRPFDFSFPLTVP